MDSFSHDILVVDDVDLNVEILSRILRSVGYQVRQANSGEEALDQIHEKIPNLILLDMILPGISGLEICAQLQKDSRFCEIPIIFITAVTGVDKIAEAFQDGAVDYVTKPFKPSEILARIKTHLRLADALQELKRLNALALDANPLTGLPGNNSINKKIKEAIERNLDAAVIYADLDHFKPYNDVYGYLKGDDAIQMLAEVLTQNADPNNDDGLHFVGHIGGDDFVLLIPAAEVTTVAEGIKADFDRRVTSLYSPTDIEAGGIHTTDRQGHKCFFPILSLSMGGLCLSGKNYAHVQQIASACAEVKKKAKQIAGTGLYMDTRTADPSDCIPAV